VSARILVDVVIRDDAGAVVARFNRALLRDHDDGTRTITPIPDDYDGDVDVEPERVAVAA
jgi:hypothetical protein